MISAKDGGGGGGSPAGYSRVRRRRGLGLGLLLHSIYMRSVFAGPPVAERTTTAPPRVKRHQAGPLGGSPFCDSLLTSFVLGSGFGLLKPTSSVNRSI